MKKMIKTINGWLLTITDLLKAILVFAIISGLLFNDPFGTIGTIGSLLDGIGSNGLAGLISLAILILVYGRNK